MDFYNTMTLENATIKKKNVVYDNSSVVVNRDVRPLLLALNIKPFPPKQLRGDISII